MTVDLQAARDLADAMESPMCMTRAEFPEAGATVRALADEVEILRETVSRYAERYALPMYPRVLEERGD